MADVSCPVGGLPYTCATIDPTFLGCCDINPCHNSNCPSSNLFPMGLGDNFTYVFGHSCQNGGQWWTCAEQTPSFQGCCETDPCNGAGCPVLVAADLSPHASQNATASAASQCVSWSSESAGYFVATTSQGSESTSTSTTSSSTSATSYITTKNIAGTNQTITLFAARNIASSTPTPHGSNPGINPGGAFANVAIIALTGMVIIFL